ncbi:cell filamentation protein Fic [Candidatus Brocadia sapporoensis]|uniref:Cell filamentation protein Fic n=1 Tax=Candidatus Brocadia sapporoensis TaxID=392547 RepID=A0A1V6LXB9_9BACT|nr:virulence RhuM family protein [Candidatus Brocadia sapporoensis]OQD44780.1 cell filamentation protein Fic [Candidatus Brocadia sapporoensis]GJQ22617.1 MAG: toxin Fic [Candidatus Brocadia sapporoensis]
MGENQNKSQIILYQTDDGQTKLQVKMEDETVWLTQDQMAELFDKGRTTITEHIQNVFKEGELEEESVCREFRRTGSDGKEYAVKHYNLDVIISVGYRVKSVRGTQFRIWSTQRLKEYLIKGFALDDERLKQGGEKARYFQELLQRIRDIRSSERNFYQKVTDIYATSIDYRKDEKQTTEFFATVQNKMHYAVHGHTAAEIIARRADSTKPLMGLTNFKGNYITTQDIKIAKNYLHEEELKRLNLIVSMYHDFAELQATNGRLMKMADSVEKLDQFLKLRERELLTNAGSVSAEQAVKKDDDKFEKYRKERDKNYVSDFDRAVKDIEQKASKQISKKKGRKNG